MLKFEFETCVRERLEIAEDCKRKRRRIVREEE